MQASPQMLQDMRNELDQTLSKLHSDSTGVVMEQARALWAKLGSLCSPPIYLLTIMMLCVVYGRAGDE